MHSRNRRTSWGNAVAGAVAALCVGLVPTLVAVAPAGADAASSLHAGGSVDEAWLTGAGAGDTVTLVQNGSPVLNPANPGSADALGSLIIRDLTPGSGYAWQDTTTGETSAPFAVLAPGANPATDSSLYTGQPMHEGLNYLTMRDGIQLAATVRYPYNSTCSATAPCPTVIEYSGYATAGPTDPIPSLLASALHTTCTDCGDPNLLPDSATDVGAVVARVAGFATVSLQMRGTGCSGGAYDLFGYPSDYDAYDAVEIVAHQDWVANHKVGMVGISYSGLSELPSAGTDPPDLAAIAPMSPTDDLFSTGYPGGIFNSGFAASWIGDRIDDAKPAATLSDGSLVPLAATPVPGVGQPWTYYEMAAEGPGSTCLANQALHGQSESLSSLVGPQLVDPGTGPGTRPLVVRPTVDERVGPAHHGAGVRVRRHAGRADRAAVDRAPVGTAQDHTGLRQPGQRWAHRLHRPADHQPLAGIPRSLRGGQGPDGADPLESLILDSFTSFAASTTAQAPLPAIRFTWATSVSQARHHFAARPPGSRSSSTTAPDRWVPATPSRPTRRLRPVAAGRPGDLAVARCPREPGHRCGAPGRRRRRSSSTRACGRPPACRRQGTPGPPIRAGTGRPFRRSTAPASRRSR